MTEVLFISMAAARLGLHPQTLRKYERLGLVRPLRTTGSMRVYSEDELTRLRAIKYLVDQKGINLAGVQQLLALAEVAQRLRELTETGGPIGRPDGRRRLVREVDRLCNLLGC